MQSFFIHTFGCQMNVHDSQRMHELLCTSGLRPVDSAEAADLIVINTCSVRDKAEQKLDSELGKLKRLKERRADPPVLAVTGCVATQRGEAMLKRLPFIDLVLGPDNLGELPALAHAIAGGAPPVVRTRFDLDDPRFLAPSSEAAAPSAFVSISKGCDERCSFCIVPSTRGPERHRAPAEIVDEVTQLVQRGALEVVLLGQTVNGYRNPISSADGASNGSDFADLLRAVAAGVPALKRLRYTSPHPRFYGPDVVQAHRELDVLCRHVHMPVQSGSDPVLKRMIRRYTRGEFLEIVRSLRQARPDLTVSTDIIVGFPGETDEDFEQTLSIMREARFTGVYAFKYSPRPGTPALRLGDDIPESVKSARLARVFELSDQLMTEHLQTLVDTVQEVLVEEPSHRGGRQLSGHTKRNEIVHLDRVDGVDRGAGIIRVKITRAFKHSLEGQPLDPLPPAGPATRTPVRLNVVQD
ncbi:MAG: tRNA (N6-isopentenyl adenosine(37)-C2)-methylthiotransferase MiaB [Deltaproteobacteria bacterium]|nr:tRNA (N6-isopentenyl adenosine(37)-C2)-methylthiotransferase MiaB [Deltaproteobacteria bacterium]